MHRTYCGTVHLTCSIKITTLQYFLTGLLTKFSSSQVSECSKYYLRGLNFSWGARLFLTTVEFSAQTSCKDVGEGECLARACSGIYISYIFHFSLPFSI